MALFCKKIRKIMMNDLFLLWIGQFKTFGNQPRSTMSVSSCFRRYHCSKRTSDHHHLTVQLKPNPQVGQCKGLVQLRKMGERVAQCCLDDDPALVDQRCSVAEGPDAYIERFLALRPKQQCQNLLTRWSISLDSSVQVYIGLMDVIITNKLLSRPWIVASSIIYSW